jgi:pyruvate/2-oxoglutarate dehydrogenase complex dihydrolipoamide acyltransferase (E2) component
MNRRRRRRLTSWIARLFLCAAAPLLAVDVKEGPVVEAGETSATIRWTTDVECGTSVVFGLSEKSLTRRVEGSLGLRHEVKLDNLQPATTYYFQAGTARKPLTSGSFQTTGKANPPPAAANPDKPGLLARIFGKKDSGATPPPAATSPPAPQKSPAAPQPAPAPPAEETWGDMDTLQDHFVRHGKDFGAKNAQDYAAQAWRFLQRAMDEALPAKLDESDGTIRIWDGKTRSFAAYNRNFTTKTYFRPNSPDYFQRQPGKPIRLRRPDKKS